MRRSGALLIGILALGSAAFAVVTANADITVAANASSGTESASAAATLFTRGTAT